MGKPKFNKQAQILSVILLILLVTYGGNSVFRVLSTAPESYVTGYQGAKARFAGVSYDGKTYGGNDLSIFSSYSFDTTLRFDPDSTGSGKPPIAGEMTAVFVPSESLGKQPSTFGNSGDDIADWLLASSRVTNPVNVYEWDLALATGASNLTAVYRMEDWQCKWFFSISSEPTGKEIKGVPTKGLALTDRNYLTDCEIWFEIDISPTWYFEGTDTAYFAIAELRLSHIGFGGKTDAGDFEEETNSEMRVSPSSGGALMPIYYGIFGKEANRAEKEAFEYNGKRLNPDLFTDKVYTKFTLNDFGVNSWFDYGTFWRADVVTVGVDVHVFVIGEWLVKDIQELKKIEEEFGRDAKTGGYGLGTAWLFSDPAGRLILLAIGAVFILLLLAIFAPTFLLGLMMLMRPSGRRK